MPDIPSPFGSGGDTFDEEGAFVPEHLPDPGPFLTEGSVLTGEEHVAVHRITRECFEQRGVYDATFGYNLARLNLDTRHPSAGLRYAEETAPPSSPDAGTDPPPAEDRRVLRAEFAPTTPFCPQSSALTVGAFRAWNGLRDAHDYDLVRVRVAESHHQSAAINERLRALAVQFCETGEVPAPEDGPGRGVDDSDDLSGEGVPDAPY